MSVLQQVYHHPNLTSEVCSMLISFVISEIYGCPFWLTRMYWVFPPSFLSLVKKWRAIPCTLICRKDGLMWSYHVHSKQAGWAQRVRPVKQQNDTCRLFFFTGKNLMDKNELLIQVFIRLWSATVSCLCIFLWCVKMPLSLKFGAVNNQCAFWSMMWSLRLSVRCVV